MAAARFDTLDYARKLERAGVPAEQAALQATALNDALAETGDLDEQLLRLENKVDRGFADMDARFKQVDARFEQIVERFDAKFEQVDARFEQIVERFDAKFDQVDARFEQIIERFGAKFEQVDVHFNALEFKLTGKIGTLHWMFGTMVALTAAIFIQSLFKL